jgi:predicted GNAT family N-acyltransferase
MIEISAIATDRLPQLVELFASTWWASERTLAQADTIVTNSDVVIGLVDDADRLVAFARVLTDTVAFAMIFDVIVAPDVRGTGLGDQLMQRLLARPELAEVGSIELVCRPDLLEFYERFGFTRSVGASRLMRRTTDHRLLAPQGAN